MRYFFGGKRCVALFLQLEVVKGWVKKKVLVKLDQESLISWISKD